MEDITIREARAEDAQALARLNREEMGYGYPVDKTKEKLAMLLESGKDKILVAELDGTVAGYVHLNDYDAAWESAGSCWLRRRTGPGKQARRQCGWYPERAAQGRMPFTALWDTAAIKSS